MHQVRSLPATTAEFRPEGQPVLEMQKNATEVYQV